MSHPPMDLKSTQDHNSLFTAQGLTCVVTGGGTGIGLAIANALAQTGAEKIFILGRRVNVLEEAAKSLNKNSKDVVVPIECDVSSLDSIQSAVKAIEKTSDHVDVLINNAGIDGPDHKSIHQAKSIAELQQTLLSTPEKWAPTFAINSSAVLLVSAAFLHLLDQGNRKRGIKIPKDADGTLRLPEKSADRRTSQIITISSIAGFNRHITAGVAYCGSKAAATAIGKAMATLLASWGIRSNVICPGLFPSEMTGPSLRKEFPYTLVPSGRPGAYEEMAAEILHLVGNGGSYTNGAVSIIDGGRLSLMPGTF